MVLCATCSSVSRPVMYILAMRGQPPNSALGPKTLLTTLDTFDYFHHVIDIVIGPVVVGFSLNAGKAGGRLVLWKENEVFKTNDRSGGD